MFTPNPNITRVDLAFPANVAHLLPPLEKFELLQTEVSDTAKKLAFHWFYHGLKSIEVKPKEGIEESKALAHLQCILGSFQPSHDVKMQAVAYLIDLWFEDVRWEPGDANRD